MLEQQNQIQIFIRKLRRWWKFNKRSFPWREEQTPPYFLLIAEILLQRTKAKQVVPVYEHFTKRFPSLEDLSLATQHEVKELIKPLGLYKERAPRLIQLAKILVQDFNSVIPEDPAELMNLPGVGTYVMSSYLCFSQGARVPIIDANVVRVLSRV